MTRDGFEKLRDWFESYVRRFACDGGELSPPLELKHAHSWQVAENARQISRELGHEAREVELAGAAGLLHDVGRFIQFSRYGSFSDADTLDHGEEGCRVLEREASDLFESDEAREQLLFAVRCHNRRTEEIPPGRTPAHDGLLRLVRDADKIDIMAIVLRSVEEDGFRALPSMLPGIDLSREVTPAVLAGVTRRESLSTASLVTVGDFLLFICSWFHDLNYLPSRRLAAGQGLVARVRLELPESSELRSFFEGITAAA
jgi:putative nucleotidyltransferase with HDIG domain